MPSLRPCDVCSRHVFVTEVKCPFCEAPLRAISAIERAPVLAGMSRAQRFAIAAAAAVAGQTLAGCSNQPEPLYGAPPQRIDAGPGTAGQTAGSSGAGGSSVGTGSGGNFATPVYGAPFPGGSGSPSTGGQGNPGSGGARAMPLYGAPVMPLDAGIDEDAGAVPEKDGGPRIQPLYGAPIPIYGAPFPKK